MASHPEPAFALLLQSYRLAAGLTQEDLAERAGLSTRGISDLERGLILRPQARTARLIAEALGLAAYDRENFLDAARQRPARRTVRMAPPTLPSGSYLGAVPIGPLIGRQMEMERITAFVVAALQGNSHLLLLSGEAGIGKTRLAQEAMLLLRERGFLVATGRCYEAESGAPFYPFLELLAKLYQAAPGNARALVPDRWPYLARLLPGEGLAAPLAVGDRQDRQRLFRAVTGFVEELATESPIAILLDDLHWADRSTINLLKLMVRQAQGRRILVLGTHRTLDALSPQVLVDSLAELHHEELVEDIGILPLSIEGTADMVRGMVGGEAGTDELVQALHGRAEGNPFFTQELLRSLVDSGDLDGWRGEDSVPELPLPETVRSLVQQRLARLEQNSQDVLVRASVLGQTFRFDDLQAFCERSEEAVEQALDHGRSASLVRIVDRDRYAFNHALIHSALYAGLSPVKGRRLHLAAGLALENLPENRRVGRASEIARHFREGEDTERTLLWTVAAGDEAAAIFAHRAAVRQYRAALELLREPGVPGATRGVIERDVLIRLGRVLVVIGDYDPAVDALARAISLSSEAGDLEHLALAVAGIARAHRDRGTTVEGLELISPLLQTLKVEELTPETGATLYIALAHLFFIAGKYADTMWAAEHAVSCARATGSEWLLAEANGRLGTALITANRLDEAREVLEAAVPLADSSGNLDALVRALTSLAATAGRSGKLREALRYRERSLAAAEQLGDQNSLVLSLSHVGGAQLWLGAWEAARAYYIRARTVADSIGECSHAPYPYFGLAYLSVVTGAFDEGAHLAEHGLEIAEQSGHLEAIFFLERVLADANIRRSRPGEARERLMALRTRLGAGHPSVPWILPSLAEAHLEFGESEQAREVANDAVARATATKQLLLLADALWIQGKVLSRLNRWDEAEEVLLDSVHRARALPYPICAARALEELGTMLSRKGEGQRATPFLEEADSMYQRLGATAYHLSYEL